MFHILCDMGLSGQHRKGRKSKEFFQVRLCNSLGLYSLLSRFKKVLNIQRDGGSEFKGSFEEEAKKRGIHLQTGRAYKKNDQAFIENFNGSLRRECTGWKKYEKEDIVQFKQEVKSYEFYFNLKRPHMALKMKTAYEALKQWKKRMSILI